MIQRMFGFTLLLVLSGCSLFHKDTTIRPWLPMLEPAELGLAVAVLQKVSGRRGDQNYVMLCQMEIEAERLAMVASTTGGNTLFSLEYQAGEITTSVSPLVPAQLDPAWVIADLQLAFWPRAAVEKGLEASELHIEYTAGARELLRGGERLVRIEYSHSNPWAGPVTFINYKFGYEYRIETLRQESLYPQPGSETLVF